MKVEHGLQEEREKGQQNPCDMKAEGGTVWVGQVDQQRGGIKEGGGLGKSLKMCVCTHISTTMKLILCHTPN